MLIQSLILSPVPVIPKLLLLIAVNRILPLPIVKGVTALGLHEVL
jgi:hypothetical protein